MKTMKIVAMILTLIVVISVACFALADEKKPVSDTEIQEYLRNAWETGKIDINEFLKYWNEGNDQQLVNRVPDCDVATLRQVWTDGTPVDKTAGYKVVVHEEDFLSIYCPEKKLNVNGKKSTVATYTCKSNAGDESQRICNVTYSVGTWVPVDMGDNNIIRIQKNMFIWWSTNRQMWVCGIAPVGYVAPVRKVKAVVSVPQTTPAPVNPTPTDTGKTIPDLPTGNPDNSTPVTTIEVADSGVTLTGLPTGSPENSAVVTVLDTGATISGLPTGQAASSDPGPANSSVVTTLSLPTGSAGN